MKEFEKYILKVHPDPNSVLIDNLHIWDEICLLAENYAKSKVKSNLHIVTGSLPISTEPISLIIKQITENADRVIEAVKIANTVTISQDTVDRSYRSQER